MAKITKAQISEKDPFGEVGRSALSAKEKIVLLENSVKMLSSVAKTVKSSLKGLAPTNAANINKISDATRKANTIAKQQEKIVRSLNVARSDSIQKSIEINEQLKIQKKQNVDLARDKLGLISVYQKESKRLIDLRNRYKELVLTNKQNTAEGKRLLRNLTSLDIKLKKVDGTVGQFQRNVGNYTKAVGRMRAGLTRLAGALGVVGGFMLLRRVLSSSFNIIRDFEQKTAELASVMATTDENAEALNENAKKLGATTAKTATEVVGLQLAYARLGFTTTEILDLTQATINGSIALNAELSATAELTGAMVNTFKQFSAADAPLILDKLTVATQKSALNFEKLQKALPIVGGAAEAAGISFDKTLALLGKLSDAGIDASSSSTALRNIFIKSEKAGLGYNQILKLIVKEQNSLTASVDRFGIRSAVSASVLSKNINATAELEKNIKNAAGAADEAARVQLNTLDGAIKLLTSAWEGWILSMNDSTKASSGLTKIIKFLGENLATIMGIVGRMITAFIVYKGTIIAINVITKIQIFLVKAQRIANLGLSRSIKLVTKSFKAMNKAQRNNAIGLIIAAVVILINELINLANATNSLEDATNNYNEQLAREQAELDGVFNKIMDTNTGTEERKELIEKINKEYGPYLDSLLTEQSTLEDIERAQELANAALAKNIAIKIKAEAVSTAQTKLLTEQFKIETVISKELREQGKSSKEIKAALTQFNELVELKAKSAEIGFGLGITAFDEKRGVDEFNAARDALINFRDQFPTVVDQFTNFNEKTLRMGQQLNATRKEVESINDTFVSFGEVADETFKDNPMFQNQGRAGSGFDFGQEIKDLRTIEDISKDITAAQKELREVATTRGQAEPIQKRIELLNLEKEAILGKTKASASSKKEIKTTLKDLKEELRLNKEKTEILVNLQTPATDRELIALKDKSLAIKVQIKQIEDLLSLEKEKGDPQIERRIQLLTAELEAKKKLSIIDIDDAIDEGVGGLRNKDLTDPNFIDEAKVDRELRQKKAEINLHFDKIDLKREQDKLEEIFQLNLKRNANNQLSSKAVLEEANKLKNKIEKNENELKKIKFEAFQENNLKEQLDLESQFKADQVAGDFKTKKQLLKAEREFQKALNLLKVEAIENEQTLLDPDSAKFKKLEVKRQDLLLKNRKIDQKNQEDSRKESLEIQQKSITLFTDFFIQQADRRIAKIDEEIAAAQRQADLLAGLAASGNITAAQSLAEQDRIIAEANLRKERLEKRKQNVLLVSSILEAYNNELEIDTPPGEAFTKAVTSTAVLQQFVAALPTFFDGIDDTGNNGQGVDGKGGFHAILHPNERVMTKDQNSKMGGLSNEDVASLVEQHRYGQFITVQPKTTNDIGNQELKQELKAVRLAIENKEVQNIELAEITQAAMTIRKTVQRGNRVTHNTFRVN